MIFIRYSCICLLFLVVCVRRLDVFSVPWHTLHPTPSCVCIQGAHKTLDTSRISISPQTDRQQPFAGYIVCVSIAYIQIEKKSSALRCVLCNRLDIRRGRKACQFPDAGNTIQEEEENCVYTILLFGWGGRQFHEHNLLSWDSLSLLLPLAG
jgi:hypothetical protein